MAYSTNTVLTTVAFLQLLDTSLLSSRHYALLTATDTAALYDLSLSSKFPLMVVKAYPNFAFTQFLLYPLYFEQVLKTKYMF